MPGEGYVCVCVCEIDNGGENEGPDPRHTPTHTHVSGVVKSLTHTHFSPYTHPHMPEVVKWLALGSRGQLNPLTSFLGGVVGQEVLKVRWGWAAWFGGEGGA